MTSEKKIEANRHNAEHSTGPRSANGKEHTRANAVKSGLYARKVLLPKENHREYQRLRTELFEKYAPADPTEETVVQLIMDDMWRLKRQPLMEAEYLKQQSSRLKSQIHAVDEKKCSVHSGDPGPTLLESHVRPGNGAPMEEISRQRRLTTRDFFQNIDRLWAMQANRNAVDGKK